MRYSATSLDKEVRRSHLSRCDRVHKKYDIDGLNAKYASEGGWEGHTRKFLVEQAIPRALKALA